MNMNDGLIHVEEDIKKKKLNKDFCITYIIHIIVEKINNNVH